MTLLAIYNTKLQDASIRADAGQQQAVTLLSQLAEQLEKPVVTTIPEPAGKSWLGFLKSKPVNDEPTPAAPKGLYLWGGVGRGKTWLMDLFFSTVGINQKKRYHFHHFMEMIHQGIKQYPDQEDPLELIAKKFARDTRLLCLDELHLTEITNARLLLPVLEHLIRHNVVLVTTSNRHPSELYQGKLKKELFVPYTDFMQQQMQVLHLDNEQDYRTVMAGVEDLENLQLDTLDEVQLAQRFAELSRGEVVENVVFTINHRQVPVVRASENIIWLDFAVACEGTRTTSDYIWMSDRYQIVMLSGIHVLGEDDEPAARRFFNMVDELYDRRVQLLFSTDVDSLDRLYQGKRLKFAFKRTLSRLIAMHSGMN